MRCINPSLYAWQLHVLYKGFNLARSARLKIGTKSVPDSVSSMDSIISTSTVPLITDSWLKACFLFSSLDSAYLPCCQVLWKKSKCDTWPPVILHLQYLFWLLENSVLVLMHTQLRTLFSNLQNDDVSWRSPEKNTLQSLFLLIQHKSTGTGYFTVVFFSIGYLSSTSEVCFRFTWRIILRSENVFR